VKASFRDLDPDREAEVEVLDVNDAEARALLLSIDLWRSWPRARRFQSEGLDCNVRRRRPEARREAGSGVARHGEGHAPDFLLGSATPMRFRR
jgi:hypothetical protein